MKSLIALLLTLPMFAANHYVRQGAGGSGDGSDWTNACTGFASSCAISSLVRGDTYYVADGAYGDQFWNKAASGTSLITIVKATIASHGTSTGWVDTYGDGQASFGNSIEFATSYWVFDGVSRATESTGHGFLIDNSATTETELCTFGSFGSPISNVTVKYTALLGRGYGNTTVFDRAFYSNAPGTTNITLQYNYSHAPYVHILTRQWDTVLVEHNYFDENNSRPASHAEPWSDSGSDNVTFRYNKIHNPEGSAVFFIGNGGGASPTASNTSANWAIYGNIIYYLAYVVASGNNSGTAGIVYCANDVSNMNWCDAWLIYNNTFYDFSYGTASGRLFFENVTGVVAPTAQNNLWDNCSDGAANDNVSPTYSYYRNTTHPAETNTQTGVSDPFVSAATANFTLAAATTSGATLSSPYNVDYAGVTRVPGSWDRGAYQYASGGSTPTIGITGKVTLSGKVTVQ